MRNRKLLISYTTELTAYINEAVELLILSSNNLLERISNIPLLKLGIDIGYHSYTYTTTKIRLFKAADAIPYYLDTRYLASLIDRNFLLV
jgi:hypothetical protein